ncbi:RNA 2',3'-cyclic phosphodiesterase [uncultured Shewanella sp.]|uniref:RNA 2',3'-cyclic phosphodiesterase n=1 Tax=uncultured Shewanella sp. TaxID=173975 RepID=UPI00260D94D8|nr:RNA 2',3'-cyclic phosphodiesterase [uncultured Shewanella sp.]
MSKNDSKRTFIGFPLTVKNQQGLIDVQQQLAATINPSAKPVQMVNLHITAAFLGQTSQIDMQKIDSLISSMSFKRSSQVLESIAYWSNAKVVCIEGKANDELAHIAVKLVEVSRKLNLYQSQHAYRPHISLFRQVSSPPFEHQPISDLLNTSKPIMTTEFSPFIIDIDELILFESQTTAAGVNYIPMKSWPLI